MDLEKSFRTEKTDMIDPNSQEINEISKESNSNESAQCTGSSSCASQQVCVLFMFHIAFLKSLSVTKR